MSESVEKIKLCIVAHFAYHALRGSNEGHIGGVENQTALMARWFAARGHQVSLLTWDEGQEEDEVVDGVRVIKICRRSAGVPGLRFFVPRWQGLIRAMRRADAEVYYQNCAEYVTGQVALWCRMNGRKFVYSVASDPDCDPSLPVMKKGRERFFYRYGLRHSDRIVVQSKRQHDMLKRGFGLDSTIMPMACRGAREEETASPPFDGSRPHRVIWVGRISRVKRPEWLIELAERLPHVEFDMVGGDPRYTDYFHDILEQAQAVPNITVHGPLCHKDIYPLYRRASLLCCTSEFEGFPNTFLEAWSFGLPIVATVDPDNLISGGMGMKAKDIGELARSIDRLLGDEEGWRSMSRRCRKYYLENHAVDGVMLRFEKLMSDTLKDRGR